MAMCFCIRKEGRKEKKQNKKTHTHLTLFTGHVSSCPRPKQYISHTSLITRSDYAFDLRNNKNAQFATALQPVMYNMTNSETECKRS